MSLHSPSGWRAEKDSLGSVMVPADRLWGAQTQRSLDHFPIGSNRMPVEVVRAYAHVKKAAAQANADLGVLPRWKADAILRVCDEILDGSLDEHFPLKVYQTGSGTHTNANVNEVIANRGNQLLGFDLATQAPLHPNDDVNMSQSSNDTFVTAMHVAAYAHCTELTIPALVALADAITEKAIAWEHVMKAGRTHLMDATLLTVGQEWSGYAAALTDARYRLEQSLTGLLQVALGGTAVGTGLNAPAGFAALAIGHLARSSGYRFQQAHNPFAAQATLDPLVHVHAALKSVCVTLFKVANDLRWLASGPRHGLNELVLPANEAGSTIMPGKVNPTQCEATLMVCLQVMGHDTTIAMAGAEGNFELNAFRPVVIADFLDSARLIADACTGLRRFLILDVDINRTQVAVNVHRSVMALTALAPHLGYERTAEIARHALTHDLTAQQAALDLGLDTDLIDAYLGTTPGGPGTYTP